MVNNRTIVVEEVLGQIFEYLPAMKNSMNVEFKPVFMYGDNKQLLDFLKQNSTGKSVYPLIWLVYPFSESHTRSNVNLKGVSLVLAVETNSVMLNFQRMEETYKKILLPLFDNIKKAFELANVVSTDGKYDIVKFPNYSSKENESTENMSTYVWDAIKVTFDIDLSGNCLRPIIF